MLTQVDHGHEQSSVFRSVAEHILPLFRPSGIVSCEGLLSELVCARAGHRSCAFCYHWNARLPFKSLLTVAVLDLRYAASDATSEASRLFFISYMLVLSITIANLLIVSQIVPWHGQLSDTNCTRALLLTCLPISNV